MPKVLVLYYSSYGHIETMANAVAEGARAAGATVDVKRVPGTAPGVRLGWCASPRVCVSSRRGQNVFPTPALRGGSVQWLDRRPALAGGLIGLLAYKPQFGVLIPIALVAGGRYDELLSRLGAKKPIPAVGFAVWIERVAAGGGNP